MAANEALRKSLLEAKDENNVEQMQNEAWRKKPSSNLAIYDCKQYGNIDGCECESKRRIWWTCETMVVRVRAIILHCSGGMHKVTTYVFNFDLLELCAAQWCHDDLKCAGNCVISTAFGLGTHV
eukprot:500605-Pelagomonas_calceolata.AAC.6